MSMPTTFMIAKTTASVTGIAKATMRPARTPRAMKLTTRMMTTACQSDSMNSAIASETVTGWSATSTGSMPIGSSAVSRASTWRILTPRARMSPPSRIAIASPIAGLPLARNIGCGGSAKPRVTRAMSARRMMRPPATKLMSRMSCSVANAPVTRIVMFSSPVCTIPAGCTMFCAARPATSACRSMPSVASSCLENSTKIRSSCAPRISILETSCTLSRAERMSSTWSRSSRWVKPSAVKPKMMPKTSPNRSLKNGPITPRGKVRAMSWTRLRTSCHATGTCPAVTDPSRSTKIEVKPARVKLRR